MFAPRDPVIIGFARTPQGKFGGALAGVSAPELGATAIRAAVRLEAFVLLAGIESKDSTAGS